MSHPLTRRETLASMLSLGAFASLASISCASQAGGSSQPASTKPTPAPTTTPAATPLFRISLAQWSLHKAHFANELTNLDFPKAAKDTYGIDAVEYVNIFFKEKNSPTYLKELKARCDDNGVRSLLIMCDGEGALGDANEVKRAQAVLNHEKWLDAAKYLGCHSIRVNAQSEGTYEEQLDRAADGLRQLCMAGDLRGINVIVENHGGLSSNGAWLAAVMKKVDHPRVGTLPDFGNFNISKDERYDMYKGVTELMPFAKGVSAKSHDFNEQGEESTKDYARLMRIVLDAKYSGYVGIEYEGSRLSEPDGIRATKKLLEKVRDQLATK